MSKASAVTLPCLMILLDYWPLARLRLGWRRLLAEKSRFWRCLSPRAARPFSARTKRRCPNAVRSPIRECVLSAGAYLRKTVWPATSPFLSAPERGEPLGVVDPVVGSPRRPSSPSASERKASLLIGWLWFCVALAPMIGLIQVGKQGMADRYAYVPLIGLAVAAAWAIPIRPGRERASDFCRRVC